MNIFILAVILSCKILIKKYSLYPTSLLRTKKSWDFDMYVHDFNANVLIE